MCELPKASLRYLFLFRLRMTISLGGKKVLVLIQKVWNYEFVISDCNVMYNEYELIELEQE